MVAGIISGLTTGYTSNRIMGNAEGITLNENTMLLRQNPGRASVFEELIHATQFRQSLNDGSQISRIQNEFAAQGG